jgi:hypothetical protein
VQKRLKKEQKSLSLAGRGEGRLTGKDAIGEGTSKIDRRVGKTGRIAQEMVRKPKVAGQG